MADELDVLLEKVIDPGLRADLRAAVDKVRAKRSFGLVFESHLPERVRLPDYPVRRGTKVVRRTDKRDEPMKVESVRRGQATVVTGDGSREMLPLDDLVVVAEFGEPVYPGLASVDWKYDNNYVDGEDAYRHSKWLAFMERRLLLAKELLNPDHSALIVTIDEKEYLRLGLLLNQVFPSATSQMVSSVINPAGTGRKNEFSRTNEYIYFLQFGDLAVQPMMPVAAVDTPVEWEPFRRRDLQSVRHTRPRQFYPIVARHAG